MGIWEDGVVQHETVLRADAFLRIANGFENDVCHATTPLGKTTSAHVRHFTAGEIVVETLSDIL